MKTIHPNQQNVIFKDAVTGDLFLIKSTLKSKETMKWTDGVDYPVFGVEISSKSHPAFKDNGIIEAPRGSRAESFAKRYNRAANA